LTRGERDPYDHSALAIPLGRVQPGQASPPPGGGREGAWPWPLRPTTRDW
jgi:hypothetical protein